MDDEVQRLRRFGMTIERERREQRVSRETFAAKCGLSGSTIKTLETNLNPDRKWNAKTKHAIESAFGWGHGSFDALLAGGDPTPAHPQAASISDGPTTRVLRLEREVVEFIERIAFAEMRNINTVVEEAFDLYWKVNAPRPEIRSVS